jgi:nitrate reductase NapAB chaperone NapD
MSVLCEQHKKITQNNEVYGYHNIFTAVNEVDNFKITKIDFDEGKSICSVELEYAGELIDFYEEVNKLYDSNNMLYINNITIKNNEKNKYLMSLSAKFIKNN